MVLRGRTIECFVDVTEAVGEIDPGVHHCQGNKILEKWFSNIDDDFGHKKLEIGEICVLRRVSAGQVITSQHLRQFNNRAFGCNGKTFCINSKHR